MVDTLRSDSFFEQHMSLGAVRLSLNLHRYLSQTKSIEEFGERIQKILNKIHITNYSHTYIKGPCDYLDPFGTFNPKITDEYAEHGFHLYDSMGEALQRKKTPMFRSQMEAHILSAPYETKTFAQNREIISFLQSKGIFDIYNIPLHRESENYYALFSISSQNMRSEDFVAIVNRNREVLHLLADAVNDVGMCKYKTRFHDLKKNPRLPIWGRPLELLQLLVVEGFTLQQARRRMGIGESTARKYTQELREAFNVNGTVDLYRAAQKARCLEEF